MRTTLYNQIRGLMKTFGVVLGPGKGSTFVRQVEHNIPGDEIVKTVITSLLSAWKTITLELKKLDDQIKEVVRDSPVHTNLMTIPGMGS
jgi:transposase